jgi:hypothetical protein
VSPLSLSLLHPHSTDDTISLSLSLSLSLSTFSFYTSIPGNLSPASANNAVMIVSVT